MVKRLRLSIYPEFTVHARITIMRVLLSPVVHCTGFFMFLLQDFKKYITCKQKWIISDSDEIVCSFED